MGNEAKIGNVLLHLSVVESTNEIANSLLAKSEPIEGAVISADFQRAGRGQYGKSWVSEPGKNILLSVILFPAFLRARNGFLLNLMAAQTVAELFNHFLESGSAKIKWPNDVLVSDRKVAGILIQNTIKKERIQSSVLGFGVNVNQIFQADSEMVGTPESLSSLAGKVFDLPQLRLLFLQLLEFNYALLKKDRKALVERANASLYSRGRTIEIQNRESGRVLNAEILEVDEGGKAKILCDGSRRWVSVFDWKILTG